IGRILRPAARVRCRRLWLLWLLWLHGAAAFPWHVVARRARPSAGRTVSHHMPARAVRPRPPAAPARLFKRCLAIIPKTPSRWVWVSVFQCGTRLGRREAATMEVVQAIGQALLTAAGMFWEVLWPLVLGFGLSAIVQALVSHRTLARLLGGDSPRQLSLAALF